ncbi:hypothetical protein [Longimicrobium sp.]|uniref:hypothetical protein n=1 Tax=Longimicrobium sp. TaxID=2029185 RepID=UPI002C818ECB|nr:hypothetical protein [Longimicrobium sp.]HSU16103.1 hypothetical protein [Longimicrobium sp.]
MNSDLMRGKLIPMLIAVLLACAGCSWGIDRGMEFPPLDAGVTMAVVRHGQAASSEERRDTIRDPARLRALVRFVDERRAGWEQPWYGVPVPYTIVEFRAGSEMEGSFGIGTNFFETLRNGDFYSRAASRQELAEFSRLIGEPPPSGTRR